MSGDIRVVCPEEMSGEISGGNTRAKCPRKGPEDVRVNVYETVPREMSEDVWGMSRRQCPGKCPRMSGGTSGEMPGKRWRMTEGYPGKCLGCPEDVWGNVRRKMGISRGMSGECTGKIYGGNVQGKCRGGESGGMSCIRLFLW